MRAAKKNSAIMLSAFVFISTYIFSVWILRYYVGGDQRYYTALYDSLRNTPFYAISKTQYNYTGSREPLYGILMWFFAGLYEKDAVISAFNAILMSTIAYWLVSQKVNKLFLLLVFTNYYMLVLLTSAERLKFAYLFAALSVVLPPAWRFAAAACSLLNHFSVIIIFLSISLPERARLAIASLRTGGFKALTSIVFLVAILSSFFIFYMLSRASYTEKIEAYQAYDVMEVASGALLAAVALFVSKQRLHVLMLLTLPLIATFVFGGGRMNMITATVFVYTVVRESRTGHPLVLLLMAYLSFKSIGYIDSVLQYGTGFLTAR